MEPDAIVRSSLGYREQVRRLAPCRQVSGRDHRFVRSRIGDWRVCAVCGVTATETDWIARLERLAP